MDQDNTGRAALEECLALLEAGTDAAKAADLVRLALAKGVDPAREPVACEHCKGTGHAPDAFKAMMGRAKDEEYPCLHCRATGKSRPFWPRLVTGWEWSGEKPLTKGWREPGYVAVRPCAEEHKDRTFLGYLIGDAALSASLTVDDAGHMKAGPSFRNPAIFVFSLGKVIYGCESWWGTIDGPEDLSDITDQTIDSTFYVAALKAMAEKAEKAAAAEGGEA